MASKSVRSDVGREGLPPYILLALVVILALVPRLVQAQEPPPHRAGLVIVHGDGRVLTRCVAFTEEAISGTDLLRRSGLGVVVTTYGGLGQAVCAIDGEGCPADDCFCRCRGGACAYWTYSHLQPDGSWLLSPVGAGSWLLHDGDVDGWVWGDGSVAPPAISFEAICGPLPRPAPAATVGHTATPQPFRSPSPAPSPTPSPSPAPRESLSPVPPASSAPDPTATPFPPSPVLLTPSPVVSLSPPSSSSPVASSSLSNYVLLALLVLLLTGGLAWTMRRGR